MFVVINILWEFYFVDLLLVVYVYLQSGFCVMQFEFVGVIGLLGILLLDFKSLVYSGSVGLVLVFVLKRFDWFN